MHVTPRAVKPRAISGDARVGDEPDTFAGMLAAFAAGGRGRAERKVIPAVHDSMKALPTIETITRCGACAPTGRLRRPPKDAKAEGEAQGLEARVWPRTLNAWDATWR